LSLLAVTFVVAPFLAAEPSRAAPPAGATTGYTTLVGDGCTLATIDLTTGVLTKLPADASDTACVFDLAIGPDGTLYGTIANDGSRSVVLVSFDTTTGEGTELGPLTGDFTTSTQFGEELGLTFGPDNQLYVFMGTSNPACGSTLCLYQVAPDTLTATLIGPVGAPGGPFDDKPLLFGTSLCEGPLWTSVLRAETDPAIQYLTTVDPTTGTATQGAAIDSRINGLEADRSSESVYVLTRPSDAPATLSVVNPATGAFNEVGPITLDGQNLAVSTLAIPGGCTPAPVPTTTVAPTTTAAPAAAATEAAPRFTG
jgi:hypothetical protein